MIHQRLHSKLLSPVTLAPLWLPCSLLTGNEKIKDHTACENALKTDEPFTDIGMTVTNNNNNNNMLISKITITAPRQELPIIKFFKKENALEKRSL